MLSRLELFKGSFEDRLRICDGEKFTVASLLDHMDWMPADWVQREIALLVRNMDREKGRVYWRSWSENVHSAPLMWLNPRRVDDTGDRVCMYFSTWIAPLKDTPFAISERCHAWGNGYQKPSTATMITTGLKIVTFPVWKNFTSAASKDHAAQMELFYKCQKSAYDAFRETLLHARPRLMEYIPLRQEGGMVWVDIGGGTYFDPQKNLSPNISILSRPSLIVPLVTSDRFQVPAEISNTFQWRLSVRISNASTLSTSPRLYFPWLRSASRNSAWRILSPWSNTM